MNSHPLDTLMDLAREARNKAGQVLAGERGNQEHLQGQVDMLVRYRQEYAQRLQQCMDRGIDLATLQDYQTFLASLDTAIAGARNNLQTQQETVSRCQEHWREKEYRLASFNTLASRRRAQQTQRAQRLENREHDEIGNNLYTRGRPGLASNDDSQEIL